MTTLPQRIGRMPLLSVLLGPVGAVVLVFFSTTSSPISAAVLVVGVGVVAAMFAWPFFAFLLTALVVPLERLGRFSDDSAVYTFSLMKVLGVLAVASLLIHWLLGKRQLKFPLPLILYSTYAAFGFLSLTYTSDYTGGTRLLSLLLGNVLFFFLVTNIVEDKKHAEMAILSWLLATLVIGLVTIFQFHNPAAIVDDLAYIMGDSQLTTQNRFAMIIYDSLADDPNRAKRAIGATSHPAVYAINLILALPFYAYFFRTAPQRWIRYASIFSGFVACYNIFLCNTRAALVTLVVVIGLFFLTGLLRLSARVSVAIVLLTAAFLATTPSDTWRRALNFATYSTSTDVMEERGLMWRASMEIIADHWVTGVGVGNTKEIPQRVKVPMNISSAHNDVLAILVETGLFGFLIMVAFLFCLHQRCRFLERFFRQQGEFGAALLPLAARVGLYAVLFFGLQIEALTLPLKGFWLAMGLVVALSERAVLTTWQVSSTLPRNPY